MAKINHQQKDGEEKIHLALSSLFSRNGNKNLWCCAACERSLWREQYTLPGSDAISVGKIFPRSMSYFDCSVDIWIFRLWHVSWVRVNHLQNIVLVIKSTILTLNLFDIFRTVSFSHLYGPPKNNDSIQTNKKDSWIPERIGGSSIKGDATKCSKHANCGSLGGYCCPTDEGVMLECCNR